jgi:hypothetical protein
LDDAFRISVLTPAFNSEPRYLRQLLQPLPNVTVLDAHEVWAEGE